MAEVYKAEVTHRSTVYRIHYTYPDSVSALFDGGPGFYMLETGWSGNCGEWIQLQDNSVAWDYLAEKMPIMAKREGDKEGWVLAFRAAGVEVFN